MLRVEEGGDDSDDDDDKAGVYSRPVILMMGSEVVEGLR